MPAARLTCSTGQPVSTGIRLVGISGQPVATGWSDSNPSTALALIARHYRLLLPEPPVKVMNSQKCYLLFLFAIYSIRV